MVRWAIVVMAFCGFLVFAVMAKAHPFPVACAKQDKMMENLRINHKERVIAMGVTKRGLMIQLMEANNGSWTLLLTSPTGNACILETGDAWEMIPRSEY